MGLFEKIFKKPAPGKAAESAGTFQTLTAYTPTFTSWGGEIFESELVRSAIDARARHISKLEVTLEGSAKPRLKTRLKQGPNDWQTWSQFLYRLSTILDLQNTAFIVPVLGDYGEAIGIYPVLPSRCEVVQVNGAPWIRYTFSNGQKAAIEMSLCGTMTKHQYHDDFFGDSNKALGDTMQLISMQRQGIEEAVKNSNTFRFMARMNNFMAPPDLAKERERFNRQNLREEGGGLLLFPNTYSDIKQIESKPYVVDAEQLAMIRTNVFNYFGVNEEILQNKADGDQMDAFFDGAIEPFSIQLSDVLTRMLFTPLERGTGNKAVVTANRLQYMKTSAKISMAQQLGDRGMIMIDEVRALFNYPPLPNGAGQRAPIRGEYYNAGERKGDEDDAGQT
jgi:hypothetical protein